jgi:Cft2 family RNA processing exonuclease
MSVSGSILRAISGCGSKGPACFVVETAAGRFMLDLGYGPQPGLWPNVDGVGHIDALLLSHGHQDHAGGLSLLPRIGNPPVYATPPVMRGLPPAIDSRPLPLCGMTDVLGVRIQTGRSGHAPGGIWLHLAVGDGVLYMGDFSSESILYAYDPPPHAATVIIDASYGDYDAALTDSHPRLHSVLDAAPTLLPVPENGRGPDIALHLVRSGREAPYIDAVMREAMRWLATGGRESLRENVVADLERLAVTAPSVEDARGVMLANRADGAGGKVAELITRWESQRGPAIVFTGYLPPGTPAERLTRSGRAQYLRWNVHPRLSDNAALVHATGARSVMPAFGDAKHLPAWQRVFAPARVVIGENIPL